MRASGFFGHWAKYIMDKKASGSAGVNTESAMEHPTDQRDKKYRIFVMESHRGLKKEYWTEDFDSEEHAWDRIHTINGKLQFDEVPDYYMIAERRVEVVFPGLVPGI
jgi:hypothetical protein